MEDFIKHFPALSTCTYLNTPANGLVPKPVFDWRRQHDLDLMNHASNFRDGHKQIIESVRTTVANQFGSTINETALIPNFSFGMNTLLEGMPQGQKILLLKDDYPSVIWPVVTRDFDICYAEINAELEKNIEEAVAKKKPDVFIFSLVQWLSGIKINFEFLKQLKNRYSDLLIVADGTQYLGTENFSFSESAIDVLGASAYKWLTAGYGNGFIMVKETAQERIFPKTIGFNSAESFASLATDTAFIKHFEPGHQDTLNYGSLEQSILFQRKLGSDKIYNQIKTLSLQAKERFSKMGLLQDDILKRREHSPIFNLKGDTEMFHKLRDNNIICALRGGGIRVGFHYYNTEDDLDEILTVFKRELKSL